MDSGSIDSIHPLARPLVAQYGIERVRDAAIRVHGFPLELITIPGEVVRLVDWLSGSKE